MSSYSIYDARGMRPINSTASIVVSSSKKGSSRKSRVIVHDNPLKRNNLRPKRQTDYSKIVNVFYSKSRKKDAERAAERIKKHSLLPNLIAAPNEPDVKKLKGFLYYFIKDNFYYNLAEKTIKIINGIENVTPKYLRQESDTSILFSIWLVGAATPGQRKVSCASQKKL